MAAPTTDQIVSMLTAGGQTDAAAWLRANPNQSAKVGAWGYGSTAPQAPVTSGIIPGPTSIIGVGPVSYVPGIGYVDASGKPVGGGSGDPNQGVPRTVGRTAPLVPGGLNVPYGSDYFAPTLDAYTRMALANLQNTQFMSQLGQQGQQFQQTALMNAAQALASLYAQGPQSAAELAFSNAGMGFPAIGGNGAALASLIRSSTYGGSAPDSTLDFGNGQSVTIPSTLGGQALARLRADPNLAGVIASFAKAAGNPDLLSRSAAAALPTGFFTPRYGNPVLPGMGL